MKSVLRKIAGVALVAALVLSVIGCEQPAASGGNNGGGDVPAVMPAVDDTTLDGWYVKTALVCGKPLNQEIIYIKGNTCHRWFAEFSSGSNPRLTEMNGYKSSDYDENYKVFEDYEFWLDSEDPKVCYIDYKDHELTTDSDGKTWLIRRNNSSYFYQKVYSPEWTSSKYVCEYNIYQKGTAEMIIPNSERILISIDGDRYFSEGVFKDGSSFKLNSGSPMEPVYCGPWTISINEDATLTYAGEGVNSHPELAGTYRRYVHPKAWPVLSSSNTTYPAN
ncbi:MAG: hypothetical protein MJ160_02520 [Treponema sp.]|nr:hypothetical protein [Treponema sp.]